MLHILFEKMAADYPHHTAIQYEDEDPLTYQEVNRRANQLAHTLLQNAIQIQNKVLVRLERTPEQIIVLLALLKIGAIYIPLSIEQPESRLKQILTDCSPKLIITSALLENTDHLSSHYSSLPVLFLDNEAVYIREQSAEKPAGIDLQDNLIAYIAYSSGSTGSPKGIPIKHAGMTRYWEGILKSQIKHKAPRVLANVSIDFDAHVWEYLMAWTFGSALYLTHNETRKDSQKLANFIIKHHVSDMTLTPSVLRTFTELQIRAFATSGLKAIYSTGDACTLDIVSQFTKYNIAIFNCYGPTEATFGLSMLPCKPNDFYQGMAPIGLPPADSKISIQIIDESGKREVNEEEMGELVIHSPYLTPGYINVKNDPFKKINGMGYKTGDKFIKHGGLLYYKGRAHHLAHIKIRGQLVDIMGIEGLLRNHPLVTDACVIVRDDLGKEPLLVAFIVSTTPLSTSELRHYCRTSLGIASIPSYFMKLQTFPLNSSGKVDRDALTKKEFILERDMRVPYVAVRTTLEKTLLSLWEDTLDIPFQFKTKIGIKDVFNNLNGDSIKAMLLIGKIRNIFNIDLPITSIGSLEDLSLEKLADIVFIYLTQKNASFIVKLAKEGDEELAPLFFMPPISGESSLTYQKLINALKTPRKIYTIDAPTLRDPMITSLSIKKMATSYLNLIRKIQPKGAINVVGWSSGGLLAYEIAVQTEKQGIPAEFVGIIDESAPPKANAFSDEIFSNELIELMQYFANQHGFSIDISSNSLACLSKEKQIEVIFNHIPPLSPLSQNLLEHVKHFLLAELYYQPDKLEVSPPTVFSTLPTRKKELARTQDAETMATLGWEKYSKLYTTTSKINGDHFSIIEEPSELASRIDYAVRPQLTVENKRKTSEKELEERLLKIEQALAISEKKESLPSKKTGTIQLFKEKSISDAEPHSSQENFTTTIKAKL